MCGAKLYLLSRVGVGVLCGVVLVCWGLPGLGIYYCSLMHVVLNTDFVLRLVYWLCVVFTTWWV